MLSLLILAAGDNTAVPPDDGTGISIIAIVLAAIVVGAILLWAVFVRGARTSRGGVQPPPEETGRSHPGNPPLESIEPRS